MERRKIGKDTIRVHHFICTHFAINQLPPTQREIAKGCYMALSSVRRHLDILDLMDFIRYHPSTARGIVLLKQKEETNNNT